MENNRLITVLFHQAVYKYFLLVFFFVGGFFVKVEFEYHFSCCFCFRYQCCCFCCCRYYLFSFLEVKVVRLILWFDFLSNPVEFENQTIDSISSVAILILTLYSKLNRMFLLFIGQLGYNQNCIRLGEVEV